MSKQFKKTTIGEHAGSARYHAYNVGLAIDLNDIIAAIVFHHVHMNIERLVENKCVDNDGMAWLTVSKTGIVRFLPEFSESQIKTAINKLTENGLLAKKQSNRKNSYTLTNAGWAYGPLLEEEGPVKAPKAAVKKDAEEAKAAAKTRSNDAISVSDDVKEIIDYVNEKTGKCFNYASSYIKNINELFAAGYTKDQMLAVVDHRFEELSGSRDFNTGLNPSKLFYIKTFEKFLDDVKKDSDITMTPSQLERDTEEKEAYHLREAEKCKCQRLILETESDNLPFDFTEATPEEMIKNSAKRERYHLNEANKFSNMRKFIRSVKQ